MLIDLVETSSLGLNESIRKVCPVCQEVNQRSFVIWRNEEGVFYKCYRDSCGVYGKVHNINLGFESRTSSSRLVQPPKLSTYDYPCVPLRDQEVSFFADQFEIKSGALSLLKVARNPVLNTFVFPLYDYYNNQVGVVDRDYQNKEGRPKTLSYWTDVTDCRVGWAPTNFRMLSTKPTNIIIVVEDYVSMAKVAVYAPLGLRACTLLGTSFNEATAVYLSSLVPHMVMCLDYDAQKTAMKHKTRYAPLFKSWTNWCLLKDVKDTPRAELEPQLDQIIQRIASGN